MCGIVGYCGNKQAAPILLEGLGKLEYRGYDSAGIAVRDGADKVRIVKAKGRLAELANKTDDGKAMADAIYAIVKYPAMYKSLHELGQAEVNNIKWSDAGLKVRRIYDGVINHTL